MDLQRTLKVLEDVKTEETELEIQRLLVQLRDLYSQNPDDGNAIPGAVSDLLTALSKSRFKEYAPTDLRILESINGADITGIPLTTVVNSIIEHGLHPKVVAEKLSELIKRRKEFLNHISATFDGLVSLGFVAEHAINEEQGEVGIILPETLTNNELSSVASQLEDWNDLMKQLHEMSGEGARDAKVTSVSNGSIILYFLESLPALVLLSVLLKNLADTALSIQKYQHLRNEYNAEGLPKAVVDKLISFESKKAKESIGKIVDEIFENEEVTKQYSDEEKNDAKAKLNRVINRLVKSMKNGFVFEVNPPKPVQIASEEPDEEKLKKQKLLNARIATIGSVLGITMNLVKGAIDWTPMLMLPEPEDVITPNQIDTGELDGDKDDDANANLA